MKGFMYALELMALTVWASQGYAKEVSTEKIKQAIIQESIDVLLLLFWSKIVSKVKFTWILKFTQILRVTRFCA